MLIKVFIEKKRSSDQKSPVSESILRVYKNVGDYVEIGDLLFITADSEKVNEYVSNMCGVVRKIYCRSGDQITADTPVLEILGTCKSTCQTNVNVEEINCEAANTTSPQLECAPCSRKKVPANVCPIKATSYAKMLAKKLGLSLECIQGTGPGNWITRNDVLTCAAEKGLISSNVDFDDSSLFVNENLHECATSQSEPSACNKNNSAQTCSAENLHQINEKAHGEKLNSWCWCCSKENLEDAECDNCIYETNQDDNNDNLFEIKDQPLLEISSKIDVTKIVDKCRGVCGSTNQPLSVSLLSYFLKVLAKTLKVFPIFNSTVSEDGQLVNNDDNVLGLSAGSSPFCKTAGICLKNADKLSLCEVAHQLKELRTNKRCQKASCEMNPTLIVHDLMQYGSKNEIKLEQNHLAVFAVEDVFKVSIKNTQNEGQTFYFAPFSFLVDQRYIDDDLAYDFIDVFKETFTDEINCETQNC